MAIKAYYDGSECDLFITLAGFAAPEHVWSRFEVEWKQVLDSEQVTRFHAVDTMGLSKEFAKKRGWDEARVNAFVTRLLNVIEQFRSENLRAYSCCISLADFRKAQQEFESLKDKKVEAICVDHCVGGLQLTSEDLATPKPITLYFDRGERFLHTIKQVWDCKRRAAQHTGGWPRQIADILPANSQDECALQAADLLAWTVHRHYTSIDREDLYAREDLYIPLIIMNHRYWFIDYEELKQRYGSRAEGVNRICLRG